MSWNKHVDSAAKKGMNTISFLCRNLCSCLHNVKEICYKASVQLLMEYASYTWDLHMQRNIKKIESVQCYSARFIMNDYSLESSISNMINTLQWEPLQHHRAASNVSMLYRISYNLVSAWSFRCLGRSM